LKYNVLVVFFCLIVADLLKGTPASQQQTSPQKDTFHDSCRRQSKRALTFNDVDPQDRFALPPHT
jgi:hypothetical protein